MAPQLYRLVDKSTLLSKSIQLAMLIIMDLGKGKCSTKKEARVKTMKEIEFQQERGASEVPRIISEEEVSLIRACSQTINSMRILSTEFQWAC